MNGNNNQSLILPSLVSARSPLSWVKRNPLLKIAAYILLMVQQWLDNLEIENCTLAKLLTHLIPSQCPFERDIKIFGRVVLHIPPLCQLNPIYEQLVGLRFRAICCLVDQCGER